LVDAEVEWCRARHISHTAILATARTVDHVMGTLFHYFPPLLHLNLRRRGARPPPTHAAYEADSRDLAPAVNGVAQRPSVFSLLVEPRAARLLRKLAQSLRVPQGR